MIKGKAVVGFGIGDILMTALYNKEKKDCLVVLHSQENEEISEEEFKISKDDTILMFTDTESIDVLVDVLLETKRMMIGEIKEEKQG